MIFTWVRKQNSRHAKRVGNLRAFFCRKCLGNEAMRFFTWYPRQDCWRAKRCGTALKIFCARVQIFCARIQFYLLFSSLECGFPDFPIRPPWGKHAPLDMRSAGVGRRGCLPRTQVHSSCAKMRKLSLDWICPLRSCSTF